MRTIVTIFFPGVRSTQPSDRQTAFMKNYIMLSMVLTATILAGFLTVFTFCFWIWSFSKVDYVVASAGFCVVGSMFCLDLVCLTCWQSMSDEELMLND